MPATWTSVVKKSIQSKQLLSFCPAHAQERLLYLLKVEQKFYFGWTITQAKMKVEEMADLYVTPKRLFKVFVAFSGSSSSEEGCLDTNAYWKTLESFR